MGVGGEARRFIGIPLNRTAALGGATSPPVAGPAETKELRFLSPTRTPTSEAAALLT